MGLDDRTLVIGDEEIDFKLLVTLLKMKNFSTMTINAEGQLFFLTRRTS